MVDEKSVAEILHKEFSGIVDEDKINKIAKQIVELEEEWEELKIVDKEMGWRFSVQCPDICYLGEKAKEGDVFKILRKKRK
jgi:hypothetical protein